LAKFHGLARVGISIVPASSVGDVNRLFLRRPRGDILGSAPGASDMNSNIRHRKFRTQLGDQSCGWNDALVTTAVAPAKDVGGPVQQVAKYCRMPSLLTELYELSFHAGHVL
jgi:hypothetical protein